MRPQTEILQTVGDDPLTELMELDMYYGWSRRIGKLRSVFAERRSHLPLFMAVGTLVLGCALIGAYLFITL
ncbi:MAG: hypothetical protein DRN37_08220 [Thermoplasmata archaeon]|nr:MAG: hypothetical protein B6U90_05655 [Thermoplasmatales archaeon ex4484_6]RLF56379.1 MAG: hypothetical protein DRN37_08220 [Thermoplasmata archaeon]RLF68775.1 MAG: hypothetical protein DRN57_02990 [Thermoplasmata archaeon]